jgi:hypothetical protein
MVFREGRENVLQEGSSCLLCLRRALRRRMAAGYARILDSKRVLEGERGRRQRPEFWHVRMLLHLDPSSPTRLRKRVEAGAGADHWLAKGSVPGTRRKWGLPEFWQVGVAS